LLYGIRRDDGVSDELCESFQKTVDAMTTAIEPNASPQAKGHMRSAMTEFQALVEKECVVEEGELATIGHGVAVSPSELGDRAGLGLKAVGRSFALGDRITKYDGERIQLPESQRRQSPRIADGCDPDKYAAAAGCDVQTHIMARAAPELGNHIYSSTLMAIEASQKMGVAAAPTPITARTRTRRRLAKEIKSSLRPPSISKTATRSTSTTAMARTWRWARVDGCRS